jgi:hypothetical protein
MAADMGATEREHIGHVFVDHGSVVVLDPMYADVSDKDQERFLEALEERAGVRIDCDEDLPEGIDHIGVWIGTGIGDGRYPVYADLIEVPGAGGWRVARIVIDCLGMEDEPQSAMLREDLIEAVGQVREQTGGALDAKLPYDKSRAG